MAKIVSINDVEKISKTLKQGGKKIVLAGGCFDILHIGHITFLKKAKKEGDVLFVFVESDESVKKQKGIERPIHSQAQRVELVSSLSFVDFVIPLVYFSNNESYDDLIEKISPNVIATTSPDKNVTHKKRQADKFGAKLVFVTEKIGDISTSKILEILKSEI